MTPKFDLGSSFGIMQGRLSIQTERGYQSFPWETWKQEFQLANVRGFDHIEWVLDSWRVFENPILTKTNLVNDLASTSGIGVISVCADYLMDSPLDNSVTEPWIVLNKLIESMNELGSSWLVIPCVDQSSLRTKRSLEHFVRASERLSKELSGTEIRVSLETDLAPREFATLLQDLDPEIFGVNYDIGNSASLGYECDEEFGAYGERISLVHIKDRIFGGGSVLLGEGDAKILRVFELLREIKFNGPVTMQAFRDPEGLGVLDKQLSWLASTLEKYS